MLEPPARHAQINCNPSSHDTWSAYALTLSSVNSSFKLPHSRAGRGVSRGFSFLRVALFDCKVCSRQQATAAALSGKLCEGLQANVVTCGRQQRLDNIAISQGRLCEAAQS